jgi:hypothetical protein
VRRPTTRSPSALAHSPRVRAEKTVTTVTTLGREGLGGPVQAEKGVTTPKRRYNPWERRTWNVIKCPNCNRSVSSGPSLTSRWHEAQHDPAVAAELAEESRRSQAYQRLLQKEARLGHEARIRQIMLRDHAAWKRRRRADETRASILARAEELRATPGPCGNPGRLLNTLAKEFSKGRHKRSRETIRGYLAKSNKQ